MGSMVQNGKRLFLRLDGDQLTALLGEAALSMPHCAVYDVLADVLFDKEQAALTGPERRAVEKISSLALLTYAYGGDVAGFHAALMSAGFAERL